MPPSNGHKQRELQYRDGLLIALLSLWLIRRRSIAALTVSRHLEFDAAGVNILLYPEDTKAKRAESFRVPEDQLLPYLLRYLKEIRPRLLGRSSSMTGFGRRIRDALLAPAASTTLSARELSRSSERPWVSMTSVAQQPPSSPWMRPTRSV